ncbi:hypothetical protein SmphiM12_037 [Sinorhizobium phage phiM12]|uniref:Uncharacterized protein n=1 Tax=Sinorhizobium phage phiM12 TaxID=1357423 RepID=S5MCQ0_9CAUD|nr:hypothetical protein AB690_gp029 [Sinorhizobium phage phiM12]AGR47669.1 hypothetical protein SmphiM12_037 [Sinorhizobium phage phiM12]
MKYRVNVVRQRHVGQIGIIPRFGVIVIFGAAHHRFAAGIDRIYVIEDFIAGHRHKLHTHQSLLGPAVGFHPQSLERFHPSMVDR